MGKYKCVFKGRKLNSIGEIYTITEVIDVDRKNEVLPALYDKYQDLRVFSISNDQDLKKA